MGKYFLFKLYISGYPTESIIELYKASGDTYARLTIPSPFLQNKKRKTISATIQPLYEKDKDVPCPAKIGLKFEWDRFWGGGKY